MTSPSEENSYVVDTELMEEMVRLSGQGEMLTKNMGGVLPEMNRDERASLHDVLDIACGPGEWALELAFENPELHIVGVDISQIMIEYAQVQAATRHLNAQFRVMSVLKHPLDFPDASFDLVNMRLIFGFMRPEQWPLLLAEGVRLLRPGGMIRLTECERPQSNRAIFERYEFLWSDAFYRDHRTFSPDGHLFGMYPALKLLLQQAGFVQLRNVPYMIDVSSNSQAHQAFFSDLLTGVQVGLPFLRRMARDPSELEELETLYEQLRELFNQEGFCAYWPLMTFLGHKPGT